MTLSISPLRSTMRLSLLIVALLLSTAFAVPFLPSSGQHAPAFSLGVRDSLMIAHSFHQHPSFGPAGGLHGATYTCDVEFQSDDLHPETNWVVDIGQASSIVSEVLAKYNLKNLDDLFPSDTLTTTEFMARQIHNDICERLGETCPEFCGRISVKLWESHKAWATYTGRPIARQ